MGPNQKFIFIKKEKNSKYSLYILTLHVHNTPMFNSILA